MSRVLKALYCRGATVYRGGALQPVPRGPVQPPPGLHLPRPPLLWEAPCTPGVRAAGHWEAAAAPQGRQGRRDSRAGRGTSRAGRGTSREGRGTSRVGRGTSRAGRGTSRVGRGTSRAGRGTSRAGRGTSRAGRGTSRLGRGTSRPGRGTREVYFNQPMMNRTLMFRLTDWLIDVSILKWWVFV